MQYDIPLFPLDTFLLPGDITQLYIFEERYKQLINKCVKKGILFGIPFSNRRNSRKLGSMVRVKEVLKNYQGGEMDILVEAVSIFRLTKFNFQKEGYLHPSGDVLVLDKLKNHKASDQLSIKFKNYLGSRDTFGNQILRDDELCIFNIANELYLSDMEKVELLQCLTKEDLDKFLINYIHYLSLLSEQEKGVFRNIYLN
jgi:hypothetical protein